MTFHTDGPSPDRGPAPAFPNHDFSPAAIMSRARAYAAERAAELAARPPRADGRSGADLLAAITAELDRAEPPKGRKLPSPCCHDGDRADRRGCDTHDDEVCDAVTQTPARVEVAADLARLCAGSGRNVPETETPASDEPAAKFPSGGNLAAPSADTARILNGGRP